LVKGRCERVSRVQHTGAKEGLGGCEALNCPGPLKLSRAPPSARVIGMTGTPRSQWPLPS
jgi:hypothetical protein